MAGTYTKKEFGVASEEQTLLKDSNGTRIINTKGKRKYTGATDSLLLRIKYTVRVAPTEQQGMHRSLESCFVLFLLSLYTCLSHLSIDPVCGRETFNFQSAAVTLAIEYLVCKIDLYLC